METIGHTVIPPPDHGSVDIDSMNAYMQPAPVAFAFCGAGWLLGCLMGGWVAARIFKESSAGIIHLWVRFFWSSALSI